jgi:mRNA interferase MazF
MKRYEIYWTRLDPGEGSEMAKTRPVVIISLNALNDKLATVTICPLTTQLHPHWRTRVPIHSAGQPAEIAVDQIRTEAKARLSSRLGALSNDEAESLRRVITEMYGEP